MLSLSATLEQLDRIEAELRAIRELLAEDTAAQAAVEGQVRDLQREAECLARCARAREGFVVG